jgi:phosphoenolpyruvate carboxykinase (ATP)
MELDYTRAMITSALEGKLDAVEYDTHPVFGIAIPKSCPGVPDGILNPRNTWSNKSTYDEKVKHLAILFVKNFEKYEAGVTKDVLSASPKV